MGTYIHEIGKLSIPEEMWPAFFQEALQVIDEGGLFTRIYSSYMGKNYLLLRAPVAGEDECVNFTYSYFENEPWENAGISLKNRSLYSWKIGWSKFNLAVQSLYYLAETYSTTPYASTNDSLRCPGRSRDWLRYVLKRDLDFVWRRDPWGLAEEVMKWQKGSERAYGLSEDFLEKYSTDNADYKSLLSTVIVTRGAIDLCTQLKKHGILGSEGGEVENKVVRSPFDAVFLLLEEITKYKESCADTEEQQIKFLLSFLTCNDEQWSKIKRTKSNGRILLGLNLCTPQIFLKIVSELYEQNFWQLWWKIQPQLTVSQIGLKERVELENDERLISTEDFFVISSDDRLYWWREDSDVILSDKIQKWLQELVIRWKELCRGSLGGSASEWRTRFAELLSRLENLHFFEDAYYDFFANLHLPEYRAALLLLEETSEDAVRTKRLFAVYANQSLRRNVFGF